jgi:DNA recombination protein RmuC
MQSCMPIFRKLVREGFSARVWIVSPTTCMATLNTMRAILKDARMREQAGAIRRELGLLYQDVDRLGTRVENLDRHFTQAAKDITEIKISADKAGKRARRLDNFDFEEIKSDTPAHVGSELTPVWGYRLLLRKSFGYRNGKRQGMRKWPI